VNIFVAGSPLRCKSYHSSPLSFFLHYTNIQLNVGDRVLVYNSWNGKAAFFQIVVLWLFIVRPSFLGFFPLLNCSGSCWTRCACRQLLLSLLLYTLFLQLSTCHEAGLTIAQYSLKMSYHGGPGSMSYNPEMGIHRSRRKST
jgi:hypothetical protein